MTIRLKNVVVISDDIAARLWRDLPHMGRDDDPMRAAARDHAAAVERLCRDAGGSPSDLPARSRTAYTWLRFVSEPDHWRRHLSTLRRLQAALAVAPPPVGAAEIHLIAMSALWRIRERSRQRRPLLLRLHEGFMAADDAFLEEFVATWAVRDMASLNRVGRDFSLSGGFIEIAEQLSALAPEPDTAAMGRVHDLEASFHRVNSEHFNGLLKKPTLRWASVASTRTFGKYRFTEDLLTISPSLDAADVPAWVLDFVVFHELLHKALGLTPKGGRRYAHTPDFRVAERSHPRYAEADAFLKRLTRFHS